MARQPHGKKWWSSPEEERLALDELQIALDKHENSKDYHKKINESVIKRVDEIGSNENFQTIITPFNISNADYLIQCVLFFL